MNTPKIIAMYLPQFHEIPENNKWWGKGFTDWVAVKNSTPLFAGHQQPKIPEGEDYYDLSQADVLRKQSKLALEHGIDGFAIYHYWFSSKLSLLGKPVENLLANKDIEIPFFLVWDNSSWIRTWSKIQTNTNDWSPLTDKTKEREAGDGVLAKLEYGDEKEWELHLQYLLRCFKDPRYIQVDGKPLFGIWNHQKDQETIAAMFSYWDRRLKEEGFNGIALLSRYDPYHPTNRFDYLFNYEPGFSTHQNRSIIVRAWQRFKKNHVKGKKVTRFNYDKVWKRTIRFAKKNISPEIQYGCIVHYDDTPRRGHKGQLVEGESPEKFEKYLSQLIAVSKSQNKDFIFITAWNEWGEGAYLEPDESAGKSYLEAVVKAKEANR